MSRKRSDDRTKRIALICVVTGCVALASSYLLAHPALGWIVLNLILWSLPSLAIWIFARELLRALIAMLLRFRIFEIQWGAGPELLTLRVRGCALRLASIPILGHVEAASPSPHLHRLKRWILAIGPILAQTVWALLAHPMVAEGRPSPTQGLAPLAIFGLVNLGLIALHALLPFETPTGLRSDIRRIFDLLAANPRRDREERAIFYVQTCRHRIEAGDLASAQEILAQGRLALGPEPVLAALGDRLEQIALAPSSIPKELRLDDPRASTRTAFHLERASLSLLHRLRHAAASSIPILLALVLGGLAEREHLSETLQTRWARSSTEVASLGDARACQDALGHWSRWVPRLNAVAEPSAPIRMTRHDALARLHGCLGDPATATIHQTEALSAAEETLASALAAGEAGSLAAAEQGIETARQLRRIAHWHVTGNAFRESLSALVRGNQYLDRARRHAEHVVDPSERESLQIAIAREGDESDLDRARVLNRMGAHEQSQAAYDALLARRADAPDGSPEFLERLGQEYADARRDWTETPGLVRTGP